VPPPLLAQLKAAFGARAPFWAETGYARRGYFSFWQPLNHDDAGAIRSGDAQASNAVEALAAHLLPLTGCSERVVGCEWWA
jgi:hypothetical protein